MFIDELNSLLGATSALSVTVRLAGLSTEIKAMRSALRTTPNETMSTAMQKFYDSVDQIPEHFNPEMNPIGHFIRSETYCLQLIREVGVDVMKGFIMRDGERIFEVAIAKTIGYYNAYNLSLELIELVLQELRFVDFFRELLEKGSSFKSRIQDDFGFRTPGEKQLLLASIEDELRTVNALIQRFRKWIDNVQRLELYDNLCQILVHRTLLSDIGLVEELKDDIRSLYDEAEALSATNGNCIRVCEGVNKTDVLRVFHALIDSRMIHKVSGTTLSTIVEGVTTSNWDNLKSRIVHDPKLVESDALMHFLRSLLAQTSNSFVESLVEKLKVRIS